LPHRLAAEPFPRRRATFEFDVGALFIGNKEVKIVDCMMQQLGV
jgi:hypothetical protein